MPSESAVYTKPVVRDYGDLLDMTATVGGILSDVPQGTPSGAGCPPPIGNPACFT
jgi:hypothetical protein